MLYNIRGVRHPLGLFTLVEFYPRRSETLLEVYDVLAGRAVVRLANSGLRLLQVVAAKPACIIDK